MAPSEERLDISTIEQSGVDCIRFDLGNKAIGVREIGDEGGKDRYSGPENEEN